MTNVARKVVKCPICQVPHHYNEIQFNAVNDYGYWRVQCDSCEKMFILSVKNPRESSMQRNWQVRERAECPYQGSTEPVADNIAEHNLNLNAHSARFDYNAIPLYCCPVNGTNLETIAHKELAANIDTIKNEYRNVVSFCLANRAPTYQYLVIRIAVPCGCGQHHTATYYAAFRLNGTIQELPEEYLLADVTMTELENRIHGLFTKTEAMAILEKIIIRWNLISEKIIIAVPFVGHQYLSKADKLAYWQWILSVLDANKSVFITRKTARTAYKSVLADVDGLNYELLVEYGLENKLIAANTNKNDFHAKFFIGMHTAGCEALSGSANLVKGPSLENISLKNLPLAPCNAQYINKLGVVLPEPGSFKQHWVLISKSTNGWSARSMNHSDAILPVA